MKKFLSIILSMSIFLLPFGANCFANGSEDSSSDDSYSYDSDFYESNKKKTRDKSHRESSQHSKSFISANDLETGGLQVNKEEIGHKDFWIKVGIGAGLTLASIALLKFCGFFDVLSRIPNATSELFTGSLSDLLKAAKAENKEINEQLLKVLKEKSDLVEELKKCSQYLGKKSEL